MLYIFYINISIFFLQNQFINGRGVWGGHMELPLWGGPLHYPTYRPFLPSPPTPGCDCCKVGVREKLGDSYPGCIVGLCYNAQSKLAPGGARGGWVPLSSFFLLLSAQACAAVEPLPAGGGRVEGVCPQTPLW